MAAVLSKVPPGASPAGSGACCEHIELITSLTSKLEDLERRATVDHLTRIANRAALESAARRELYRMARYGHPASLAFGDVDRFKAINDAFGHPTGDEVLKGVAQVLVAHAREVDLVTRYGGEEFVVLMPNTGAMGARVIADRVRRAVEAVPHPRAGRVTMSLGVAQAAPGQGLHEWIQRADAAMYEAKLGGRNRVVVATLDECSPKDEMLTGFVQLVWHPAYECGHELIDRQHRELFALSGELMNHAASGEGDVGSLLDVLLEACGAHFADEERILKEVGYVRLDEHAAQHVRLGQQAAQLYDRCRAGNLHFGELATFIAQKVIAGHLLKGDREFFPFIR